MGTMIDGVNKIFTVEHRHGAMEINGFKNRRKMVEGEIHSTPHDEKPKDIIAWLESLKRQIDEAVLSIKKDYEIDGHKWSPREMEDL